MANKMTKLKLNEVISIDRIKLILEDNEGEKQLLELKFYLLQLLYFVGFYIIDYVIVLIF